MYVVKAGMPVKQSALICKIKWVILAESVFLHSFILHKSLLFQVIKSQQPHEGSRTLLDIFSLSLPHQSAVALQAGCYKILTHSLTRIRLVSYNYILLIYAGNIRYQGP